VRVRDCSSSIPRASTEASEDSPYLQIGETKYGRPILDRGIRLDRTTLEEAAKYALLSLDSTMRSNVTVGPPIDLLAYGVDELEVTRRRRFPAGDPDLVKIGVRWEQALRQAVAGLPQIHFRARRDAGQPKPLRNRDDPARRAAQPVLVQGRFGGADPSDTEGDRASRYATSRMFFGPYGPERPRNDQRQLSKDTLTAIRIDDIS
jgi:hypothetical protein